MINLLGRKKKDEEWKPDETKAIVAVAPGSITATTPRIGGTALAIARAELLLVCDRSGSMASADAMHGKPRYVVEDEIVADLQMKHPGLIILEAFADSAILCLDGVLPYPNGGSTMIANALKLAVDTSKGRMKVILITDGEASDDRNGILEIAKSLRGRLHTVFVGPDLSPGHKLLEELAKLSQGTYSKNKLDNPKLLEETIEKLLLKAGK